MSDANLESIPGALLPGFDEAAALGSELLESVDSKRARGYSGKIIEKDEQKVHCILAARSMGYPIRQVCSAFAVSAHTVAEIERRHAVKLATLKDRLARKFGVFVELGIDRAIEEVDSMDIDKLLVSLGIAADKLQVLTGEASVIIGTTSSEGSRFSVDGLRARLEARPLIDVTPTGSDTGKDTPTRDQAALDHPAT